MADKLQNSNDSNGLLSPGTTTYNNYDRGVQVGHADTFAPTLNLILVGTAGQQYSVSSDFYNLFVGFEPFSGDHFLVPNDRALSEYITDDVRSRFAALDDAAISEIKMLPSIIVEEFSKGSGSDKSAVFAFVTDIRKQQNGVLVHFQRYYPIPVKVLLDNSYELGTNRGFESFRTHWTIKNINLLQVLQDAGIQMWG